MNATENQASFRGDGLQAKVCPLPGGTFVAKLYAYVWDDALSNGWPCVASRPFRKRPDAESYAIAWCNS